MPTTRWRKLCSLSRSEVWTLVEAAILVVAFDLALRLFPQKVCLGFFGRQGTRKCQRVDRDRLVWLVDLADRYAPGRSSCLRQASALAWLLRRHGVATRLRIGVAREAGNLVAHSWLESEEGELFGLSEGDRYALLSTSRLPEPLRPGSQR